MGTDNSDGASMMNSYASAGSTGINVWSELSDNEKILTSNYDVVEGRLPSAYNEIVVAVDENNQISDYCLYALGILDIGDLENTMKELYKGIR